MTTVPSHVLDLPVTGVRLGRATTFGAVTADGPILLVFLRHFG
ncbi:MAG: hypothetical protein AAFY28_07770 [Actinomycetota bacterium]